MNAKLIAASVSTQVTVRDVIPIIDRMDSTISDVKNATAIETLPVQNRNILNVLAFSSGVAPDGARWMIEDPSLGGLFRVTPKQP